MKIIYNKMQFAKAVLFVDEQNEAIDLSISVISKEIMRMIRCLVSNPDSTTAYSMGLMIIKNRTIQDGLRIEIWCNPGVGNYISSELFLDQPEQPCKRRNRHET